MLRRNKSLSIIMALCLCLALLAPIFVAPPAAQAASTATVEQSLIAGQAAAANLGMIKVVIPSDGLDLASGSQLTVSWPAEVLDRNDHRVSGPAAPPVVASSAATNAQTEVIIPGNSAFATTDITATPITNSKFTLTVTGATNTSDDGVFYLSFKGLDTRNFSGDFKVSLLAVPGSIFTTQPGLVVGGVKTESGTQTYVKSLTNVTGNGGASNGALDSIAIYENAANAIDAVADSITLELKTKGYEWDTSGINFLYDWGFGFGQPLPGNTITVTGNGNDTITIRGLMANALDQSRTRPGGISIGGLIVDVDDSVARVGQDIEVKISGSRVTEQTLVVGKYCDFEGAVLEGTTTEIMAGHEGEKIGEFYIEELAPGTLVQDRVISFELPEGYEWTNGFGDSNYEIVNSSAINLGNARFPEWDGTSDNQGRIMKLEVISDSSTASNGAKIKFKKLEVMVSPAAKGDLVLEITGKAGIEGSVKVATTSPMLTIEATPVDVVLGVQGQKVADVVIKETKAEALVDRRDRTRDDRTLTLQLDEDFVFDKVPTVEVVAGDLVLDTKDIRIGGDRDSGGMLYIPIKAGSYKEAAEIKISDIYLTANRNAPVGPVYLKTAKLRTVANATNETGTFLDDRAAKVEIANNTSVPPHENLGEVSSEFVIGSNIYKVNGLSKIMDTAPYIKNDRTYVPVRFLGYALGLSDEDIVWDASNQKATFTDGTNTVELTIGSTTITVNGEAQTMDVAPEISNDRTMLPARWVAEAFGAQVGWDNLTRTVVIEK